MKKIFLVIFCFFITSLAYAHPPLAIDITYDQATKQVTATIAHQVSNPHRHYIDKVTIQVNQEPPVLKRFSFQKTAREQIAVFAIPNVKSGDTILIEAYCNKGGRLGQQIKVQ